MIVGREAEKKLFTQLLNSKKAEFMAVYGRRRVGKTYLVREFFRRQNCHFVYAVGQYQQSMETQLKNLMAAIGETFFNNAPMQTMDNWDAAFQLLHQQIMPLKKKVVIFLDELPWLVTPKSGLLELIEYYWNRHWQQNKNIILIVCGSSASWILSNIIHHQGGLHNRITQQLRILPFDLQETATFLRAEKIKLNPRQTIKLYMALGGIPYYLQLVKPGMTADENIQQLFFAEHAPLKTEFTKLFRSLFKNADSYIELIQLIHKKHYGIALTELRKQVKLTSVGGHLSQRLRDLIEAGFIIENTPYSYTRGEYYKLADEFCLFYLTWVAKIKQKRLLANYWQQQAQQQSYKIWCGYAFETLCHKHIQMIADAMNIHSSGVVSAWLYRGKNKQEQGTQIDVVIDRQDEAITLGEMKFSEHPIVVDKSLASQLMNKRDLFAKVTKTKKQLFIALITFNGVKPSYYAEDVVDHVVVLEKLLK